MILDFKTVKNITQGAVDVKQEYGGIAFYRFTEAQRSAYAECPDLMIKTHATAGIRLAFETDATVLYMSVMTEAITSRTYFSHDISVNGVVVGRLKNFSSENDVRSDNFTMPFPLGEIGGTFELGNGSKTVQIDFPWSVSSVLKELRLDGATYVCPVKLPKTIMFFGDSITQGYDVLYPTVHYSVQLAKKLNAQIYNKAIGGDIFRPQLAQLKEEYDPDYIAVAYGTNDWGKSCSRRDTENRCKEFFCNLVRCYPSAQIFAISPIWRKDHRTSRDAESFGAFSEVARIIESVAADIHTVKYIDGWNLVPHSEDYYADLCLHPNNEGFVHYGANLIKAVG